MRWLFSWYTKDMDYETGEPTEGQNNEQNIWEQAMAEPVVPEAAEEHEDLSEQEALADAAVDVAESLLKQMTSQVNSEGRVSYYLCGSMAMDLLPRVQKLETFRQVGIDGDAHSEGEITLTDDAKRSFLRGVRKKGHDFDRVGIGRVVKNSIKYSSLMDGCKNRDSLSILSSDPIDEERSFFCDPLSENQNMGKDSFYSYSRATLEDGSEIYIASPGAMIGAKAYELMRIKESRPMVARQMEIRVFNLDTPEKIEEWNAKQRERLEETMVKREKDLAMMVAGFAKVMPREQILEAAKAAIMHRMKEDEEDDPQVYPIDQSIRKLEEEISKHF